MKSKLPVLAVIPHGGYSVPEELSEYENLSKFDIFFEADSCANDLFSFRDKIVSCVDTSISRLFMDVDRPYLDVRPGSDDGVIKRVTSQGKEIFKDNMFPDEIAMANLIKRYYIPFHNIIDKTITSGTVRLVVIFRTMMAVGPKNSTDPGRPRPLFTIGNIVKTGTEETMTCPGAVAAELMNSMKKHFMDENVTVAEKFTLNKPHTESYIMKRYSESAVPVISFSVLRSLYFNEKYFNIELLKVDELRIRNLKKRIWEGFEKFFTKHF